MVPNTRGLQFFVFNGTRDFIRGTGAWSVLIGLEENGAIVAGIARKTVSRNVTINNILPGVFDTDRIKATLSAQAQAQASIFSHTSALGWVKLPSIWR